jgi:thiaminase/transcriptional activator TenA
MSDGTPDETFTEYLNALEDGEDGRFTNWCRARSEPDWTAATGHRFTEELRAGRLNDAVFREYLVQDYAFLDSLVGAFGHALGDAPSMTARSRLVDFLGTLTDEENDYFERSFDALGVPETDRNDPDLTPTTRAFQDLLRGAARTGGYAETLAVLVPAEWSYRSWAGKSMDEPPAQFYLAEWIELHDNPAFDEFVAWLRAELDREGAAASPRRQRQLARLFRRTVELEVSFFDSAYRWADSETGSDDVTATTVAGGESRW